MSVGTPPPAFAETSHDLGGGLRLAPMSATDAAWAGATCAAIEPWLSYPFSAAELTAFFAEREPGAPRFVVALDGRMAGALVVRSRWLRGPYVHMLAVAPPLQGRGIGARLLAWAEAEARAAADRNLWIAVTETNSGARRLYERCGFGVVAPLPGLVRDDRVELLMRKRLDSGN